MTAPPVALQRLRAALDAAPQEFSFVAAVRLLQALAAEPTPIGDRALPGDEPIRFAAPLTNAFPTAEISAVHRHVLAGREVDTVVSPFCALVGAAGVLPNSYTDRLQDQEDDGEAHRFLDLFHHRLHALAFRLLAKYAPWQDPTAPLWRRAAALAGLPADTPLTSRIQRFAALLAPHPRSAKSLAQCLSGYFGNIPVTVRSCLPVWVELGAERCSVLGQRHHVLRRDAVLGRRVRQPATGFGIVIGPVDASWAERLLPDGADHAELRALVAHYNRDALHVRITVQVASGAVPIACLRRAHRLGRRIRLGGRAREWYALRFAV